MRLLSLLALIVLAGCTPPSDGPPGSAEREAIADSLIRLIEDAYDFGHPDAGNRLLALYPDSGRVIAAAAGRVTTTREELAGAIGAFWEQVGRNMRGARWQWDSIHVDVLSRHSAVLTAAYRIPHVTPAGRPHVVAGAWTAVFARQPGGAWRIVHEHLSDVPPPS